MRFGLSLITTSFLTLSVVGLASAAPKVADKLLSDAPATCKMLPSYETLKSALISARKDDNGGLNNDMWGAIVDRGGVVCVMAYSGSTMDAQWPGSRVIAAQKANTANAFSLAGYALSTANLFTGAQPNGFLFGIQDSNPVDVAVAYKGPAVQYGKKNDPMVGHVLGGINVFGGGLALYNNAGKILGGLGVSGDTSCADHNIAWRMRHMMSLDYVPNGPTSDKTDQIIYDIHLNNSTSGFGHPTCVGKENDIADKLPKVSKTVAQQDKANDDKAAEIAAAPKPADPAAPAPDAKTEPVTGKTK